MEKIDATEAAAITVERRIFFILGEDYGLPDHVTTVGLYPRVVGACTNFF